MTPYLTQICDYLERTRGGLTASQAEAVFGRPTGESTVSQVLSNAQRYGHLTSTGHGRARVYRWLGKRRQPVADPQFVGIGRDGQRVASVWQYAQGMAV